MADNTVLDAGSGGDTIHTDDLAAGTYKMPTSKVIFGADGVNDGYWVAGAGAVGSTTGRVTLASDDPAVTALEIMDDWDEANRCAVNLISGQVGIAGGTGTDGATVPRVTLATDVALPAGTNAIGKLAANSGVDIGDVDVLTIANMHSADYDTGAGTDTTLAMGIAVPASGGAAVVPGDATAGLKVDLGTDNDVTLATLPDTASSDLAAQTTALQIIDDWDETNRCAVNLISGQVGIAGGTGTDGATVPRVTLATDVALPAGTNAIGKLAANSGVDIGDVDILSIAAGTNSIGHVVPEASAAATGTSTFYDNDLDETKIEVTDNPNVRIYSIHAINTTNAALYLQLFDLDADNVTVGTTAPTNQYIIPGNNDTDGSGFVLTFPVPKAYTTGFTVACTTNSEGSGAPGANACHVNIEYISAA